MQKEIFLIKMKINFLPDIIDFSPKFPKIKIWRKNNL